MISLAIIRLSLALSENLFTKDILLSAQNQPHSSIANAAFNVFWQICSENYNKFAITFNFIRWKPSLFKVWLQNTR